MTGVLTAAEFRDLVDRWLAGFCASRGVAMRRDGAVVEVDVAAESRRLEYVLVEPDPALVVATAEQLVGTTDVWLSTLSRVRARYNLPGTVVVRDDDETLMTLDLAGFEPTPTPRVVVEPDGDRAFATVTSDGVVAAMGQVAVVGTDAVVDRVRTEEAFQRQGLGSELMTALTAWAVGRGATLGILAASLEGHALYARLGWRVDGALQTISAAHPVGLPGGE